MTAERTPPEARFEAGNIPNLLTKSANYSILSPQNIIDRAHGSEGMDVADSESRGTLLNGFVLIGRDGALQFRYQKNCFEAESGRSESFIFPIPKLALVVSGEAGWHLGGRLYHVTAGDLAILRPGTIRHFENIGGDVPFVCDVFEFVPSFIPDCECAAFFIDDGEDTDSVVRAADVNGGIIQCLSAIKSELAAAMPSCADMVRALTVRTLVLISRRLGYTPSEERVMPWSTSHRSPTAPFDYSNAQIEAVAAPGDHSVEMAYVLNRIRADISGHISTDELAAVAHMSRSHFFKVFRRYNGMSVNEFITRCRVENTARLMRDRRMGVLEAAYASGFTSSSGFYRAFRRVTGCSPKEYIKKTKKDGKRSNE